MLEMFLHLQPKVQLHVSALDNSHLQAVHESLESSYTRFNMGCSEIRKLKELVIQMQCQYLL